jgi:hypothetical protein
MAIEILPNIGMCQREGVSLQRGMNFELGGNHSVILMSVRPGAPHADRFEEVGSVDQPEFTPAGHPTENGKFHSAAQLFKSGDRQPERIRVYEKIKQGILFYKGTPGHPHLRETRSMETGRRQVHQVRRH